MNIRLKNHFTVAALVSASLVLAIEYSSAAPGEGIRLTENLSLSPFVESTVFYDSNVFLDEEDERDDLFLDLVGGLSLREEKEDFSLTLRGWAQMRQYQEYTSEDNEGFQENLDIVYGQRDRLQFNLTQRHSSVFDYEFTQQGASANGRENVGLRLVEGRTRRTERVLNDVRGSVGRDFDKLETFIGATYSSVEFERQLSDWSETQVDIDIGYKLTDKTSATLAGEYGRHETDNNLDNNEFLKARCGLCSEATAKVAYRLAAGLETYDAEDAEGRSDELDQTRFHFDASGSWAATEKLDVQVFGRNEILPTSAFEENTKEVRQGSVGLSYQVTETILSSLGASYRDDTYSRPIDGIDARENLTGFQLRLAYRARRPFLRLTGLVRYEEFESNIQDNYEQLRASLALNLTY